MSNARQPSAGVFADTDPCCFPKAARVRSRGEYARVFEHGRRCHHPAMSLHRALLPGQTAARLGFAVSRKVDKRAVGRNRIKRVLRETFRQVRGHLAGGDIVVVARPAASTLDNAALAAVFLQLLQRAGALPPAGGAGTMPAVSAPSTPPRPHITGRSDSSMCA